MYTQTMSYKEWIQGDTKNNQSKWSISEKKYYFKENSKSLTTWNLKPKAQIKATAIEETENKEKPTYIEILRKSRNASTRQNLTTNLESNAKPNIHERLRSMSPTNKHRKQGKSLSRTFSKQATLTMINNKKKKINLKKK